MVVGGFLERWNVKGAGGLGIEREFEREAPTPVGLRQPGVFEGEKGGGSTRVVWDRSWNRVSE